MSQDTGSVFGKVAATDDFEAAGEHTGDGFRVGEVFLLEDAGREGMRVVRFVNRYGTLENDDAMV